MRSNAAGIPRFVAGLLSPVLLDSAPRDLLRCMLAEMLQDAEDG